MRKFLTLSFCLLCFIYSFAQPANNECPGAISLSVTTDNYCTSSYSANVTGATQSLSPCVSTTYSANDVWYKFVATATTHSIILTPTSFTDFVLQVYSGSCGSLSSIACINNTTISEIEGGTLTSLTSGNTYYVRVYSRYGWPDMQFKLCVNTNTKPIPNDEATGAIVRPVTTNGEYTKFSNIGATLSLPACTGSADNDIWFKFVATGTRHIVRYNSVGNSTYPVAGEVFSGTPDNLTSIRCYGLSDNSIDISGLTPGATYYYRIYIPTGNAAKTDFSTYVLTPPPGPANDECTGATSLSVNGNDLCTSAYSANVTGATQSLAPCVSNGYSALDVWYKFIATATTHSITLTPTSFTDFILQVYSGSCSNLSSIACIDNTSISEIEGGTLSNLTPGNTYYIRVYGKYAWPDIQFQLCVNTNIKPIPNDEATGAIVRPVTASGDFTHFSNLGATLSLPACTGSANNDIWFKFVATSNRHIVRYGTAGYTDYATAVEVFSGTPGNLTSIKCYGLSDNAADISGLTPGVTYYYRIYISTGNAVKTDFKTYISPPPPGPVNDECAGAISIAVNTDNYCATAYAANLTGATQSLAPCISTTYPALDVWYKFVATAATHSITLTPTSFTDFVLQVYSGSCGSLNSIACINNTIISEIEGGTLTNLTPGNTYYVRVYSKYAWPDMQFKLCVNINTKPIPNDEASGAILRPVTGTEYTHFSNLGATLSQPACTGNADNDIWFRFVATSTRHIVRYGSAGFDDYLTAVEVFSGTPGNLTSIRCYGLSDNAVDISNLTPGATYYYRIYIPTGDTVKTDFSTFITTPALPLKFISFKGENVNIINKLSWETAEESNVLGFEIQFSIDGVSFRKAGFTAAKNNGRPANVYTYQHTLNAVPYSNKLFYRIKEIDMDNRFIYSSIILIERKQVATVSVFPNPFKNKVYIETADRKAFTFTIADVYGRVCLRGKTTTNSIDVSQLSKGTYYLTLSYDNLIRKSFVLLKQ